MSSFVDNDSDHNMSYIRLNEESQQYRVVIRSVNKLPPNPHIGPTSQVKDTINRALNPPSTVDETESQPWESKRQKGFRQRLIACDQRSFFTGAPVADLQVAYLINTIRNNQDRKAHVVSHYVHFIRNL